MSAALSKTLKNKDVDRIFAEVPCTEDLGLSKPGQLRLFHLLVRDGKFYHEDLEKWLYRNLSRYVFSRAMLEQFRKDDDLDAAIERAIQTMRENGAADEKGMGNELDVLMLHRSLLKCKNNDARTEAELITLNRPKLFEEEQSVTTRHKEKKLCKRFLVTPR